MPIESPPPLPPGVVKHSAASPVPAAIPILQALADGLDPATGQPFPPDSPYQRAATVRALHVALEALRALPQSDTPIPPHVPPTSTRLPVDPDKPAAGQKWTPEEDQRLRDGFLAHPFIPELAAAHGRTRGALTSRLTKLGLLAPPNEPAARLDIASSSDDVPWTPEADQSLRDGLAAHRTIVELAASLSRYPGAIHSRLIHLGLMPAPPPPAPVPAAAPAADPRPLNPKPDDAFPF